MVCRIKGRLRSLVLIQGKASDVEWPVLTNLLKSSEIVVLRHESFAIMIDTGIIARLLKMAVRVWLFPQPNNEM